MGLESKNLETRAFFVIALMIVCAFLLYMYLTKGVGKLTIKGADFEFGIDVANKELGIFDLLDELLNKSEHQKQILAILERSYDLYKINSTALIDRIRRENSESPLSKGLRELLEDSKGPFDRKVQSYYDIRKESVVDALLKLEYDHPVAVKLREASDLSKGIFFDKGKDVKVLIVNSDSISNGHATVCSGCKYYGRQVLILNPNDNTKVASFFVDKTFMCREPNKLNVQIQINQNDAEAIYKNPNPHSQMDAILYAFKAGYIPQPIYIAQQ